MVHYAPFILNRKYMKAANTVFCVVHLDMAERVGYNLLRAFFGTAFFAVQKYAFQTRKS